MSRITLGSTPAAKSLEITIKKNKTTTESKNATTWFFDIDEKNRDIDANAAPSNNTPKYPANTSGIYKPDKNDKETGSPTVSNNPTQITTQIDNSFAITICASEIGSERSVSIVFVRFSSDKLLILRAGTNTIKSQGIRLKKGFMEAEPKIKISFTNKKFANTENKITTIYPTGLFR